MRRSLSLVLIVVFSICFPLNVFGQSISLDFVVSFNKIYDFSNSSWQYLWNDPIETIANVEFDIDEYSLWCPSYWEGELQQISAEFGPPTISSPFIENLEKNPTGIDPISKSFTLLTNIDYSVSWPETPLGVVPKITYQFHDIKQSNNNGLYWDYIVGFSLSNWDYDFSVEAIKERNPEEFMSYLYRAMDNQVSFFTGFNSRVLNEDYENLYGHSYQGTAQIVNISTTAPIPEPSTILLMGLGLAGLLGIRRGKKS